MTENEAIKELKEAIDCCTSGEDERFKEALGMGILAIEEIQAYRAIGTVEQINRALDLGSEVHIMLKKYQKIGTTEEFKALKGVRNNGRMLWNVQISWLRRYK